MHLCSYLPVGDDLIGPRDIKKGLHMLTNASVAVLEEDSDNQSDGDNSDVEEGQDTEAQRAVRKRSKRRTSKDTDLLSVDQMNQVS